MKLKIKIAVIAMMGISLGVKAQNFTSPISVSSSSDAIATFKTTDDKWLYTQWKSSSGQRKAYMGFNPDLTNFILGLENGANKISFPSGNIGIGTFDPKAKLDINGNLNLTSQGSSWITGKTGKGGLTFTNQLTSNDYNSLIRQKTSSGHFVNLGGLGDYFGFFGYDKNRTVNGYDHSMVMNLNNGNVGIGTITTGNHKLAVEGSIGAREIKVEASGWSDFVFERNYNLPTLLDVENHIKEKGHLKDIPSAKEVEKNGFFLGEMDAKLLQKIEELTLYTIEQEKKLKTQNSKIENQQKEIEELKKQNSKIDKQQTEVENQKSKIERLEFLVEKLLKNRN